VAFQDTLNASSGTFTFATPPPGTYQFKYVLGSSGSSYMLEAASQLVVVQ
jgi:hypothetical protein